MKYLSILVITSIISTSSTSLAEPSPEDIIKAAEDFKFEGITFKTTINQFKKMHPDAELDKSDDSDGKNKIKKYIITAKAARAAQIRYFDGEMYEIRILYKPEDLERIGGDYVLVERLVKKLGKADSDSAGLIKEPHDFEFHWRIKDAKRSIVVKGLEEGDTIIAATNDEVEAKLLEFKKMTANTGLE